MKPSVIVMRTVIASLCLVLWLGACKKESGGNAPKPEDPASSPAAKAAAPAEPTLALVNLSAAGKPWGSLRLTAPAGATATVSEDGEILSVTTDSGFSMGISSGALDVASEKAMAGDARVVVDSAELLILETKGAFQFAAQVNVGDAKYSCSSDGTATFNRAQVDTMVAACQSLAAK